MKKSLISLALVGAMALALSSCESAIDTENVPLTVSSQEVDGVFNPFFASSAPDSSVLGNTQISMLSNDKDGNPAYGENEAVVVLDYDTVTNGSGEELTTTYNFVLKNNIKFSNGSPLTIKDVLFNLYVYLDPVYTGSSTIYSTDIVGLKAYRTQTRDENEQDQFMEQFEIKADTRIENLAMELMNIIEPGMDEETLKSELELSQEFGPDYANLIKDYDTSKVLFEKELRNIYLNSKNSFKDFTLTDKTGAKVTPFTTDTEVFLCNTGYIYFNEDNKLFCELGDLSTIKSWNEEMAVQNVLNEKYPSNVVEVITGWDTALQLREQLINEELTAFSKQNEKKVVPNISGIRFSNQEESINVNGTTYTKALYDETGACTNNEVLSITINKVDPKAIWNFSFPVAPMYYYSNEEQVAKFDYKENFGVEFMSFDFMQQVVKAPYKTGVPVGAGPYIACDEHGNTEGIESGDFHQFGMVYFKANPNFIAGEPKIKYLRYKVISEANLVNSLINNEIDFIQPIAKPETVKQLNEMNDRGIRNKEIKTSGYGYIGINASKVPSIYVRRVIMHSIDVEQTAAFYKGSATPIYRSLSTESWAYPKGATAYYPYIGKGGKRPQSLDLVSPDYKEFCENNNIGPNQEFTDEQRSEFIRWMLEDKAGYIKNGNGVYSDPEGRAICNYTFTIAGAETDHPAWMALFNASNLLNKNGFDTKVSNDPQALRKLATGDLAVWAAAWGSTIDPDLYQIYHMESKASSVNNWGYKAIIANNGGLYDTELAIVEELSEMIDLGRSYLSQQDRKPVYKEALDLIMELAVELPTYQRNDLFAYNVNKIDESTLVQDTSAYNGLLSQIWNVSLVK